MRKPPPSEPDISMAACDVCGKTHPRRPTLTPALVAWVSSYALSSIYTFRSRGGILPKPVKRAGGSPRWSACDIALWLAGELPAERLDPVRPGRNGRRRAS